MRFGVLREKLIDYAVTPEEWEKARKMAIDKGPKVYDGYLLDSN